jgi:sugar phosphate isomerase/epimerase
MLPFPALPSFGARAHDIADGVTPDELARLASTAGINRLQLALMKSYPEVSAGSKLTQGLGVQFRDSMAAHGVSVAIFSCYLNLIHPDGRRRREIITTFSDYLRAAPSFGARMVVSETGSVLPDLGFSPDNFTGPAFSAVVDTVKQLCLKADKYGTLVGIEPGLNHPIYSNEMTARLVNEVASPNLRIVLDPFNLLRSEAAGGDAKTDPRNYLSLLAESFDMYGDSIEAIQLKDFVIDSSGTMPNGIRDVPVGTGALPGREALEFIWRTKPGIDVIFEGTPAALIPAAIKSLGF